MLLAHGSHICFSCHFDPMSPKGHLFPWFAGVWGFFWCWHFSFLVFFFFWGVGWGVGVMPGWIFGISGFFKKGNKAHNFINKSPTNLQNYRGNTIYV